MAKHKGWIVGPTAGALLLVAGCQNIPYYDESLNWFSWSEYDPEVRTIEAEIPPPGALEAPVASRDRTALMQGSRAGDVRSEPATGAVGGISVADASDGSSASPGDPPVGIRSSVGPSVTWRSSRGQP